MSLCETQRDRAHVASKVVSSSECVHACAGYHDECHWWSCVQPLSCEFATGPSDWPGTPCQWLSSASGGLSPSWWCVVEDTPVRALTQLHAGMRVEAQKAIIGLVKSLWKRASPNGCVEVGLLSRGDTGIGQLTDAVMVSVDQAAVLLDVQGRTNLGDVVVREVLTSFRSLAGPLGHQGGVLLEGVDHDGCGSSI